MLTQRRKSLLPLVCGAVILATLTACDDSSLPSAPKTAVLPVIAVPDIHYVNSLLDDGDGTCTSTKCTLRDAIAVASFGDSVHISVTGTITLTQGQIVVDKNLSIAGPGASSLTVSGNSTGRVFSIASTGTVSIAGVTIAQGLVSDADFGGGIHNAGTLTLRQCVISGNGAGYGGGIYNLEGSLTIERCTISGNDAHVWGGGVNSQIVTSSHVLTITYSTVSGNTALGGGGVYTKTHYDLATSTALIQNSTISGNTATYSGGVRNMQGLLRIDHSTITANIGTDAAGITSANDAATETVVKGTIIWGNNTPGGVPMDLTAVEMYRPYNSLGYNLVGVASYHVSFTTSFNQASDQTNVANAWLGPLASNGGPTKTHALLITSPAVEAGTCQGWIAGFVYTDDQRGVTRPQGMYCDVGAFELEGVGTNTPTFTFEVPALTKTYGDGSFSVAGYPTTNSGGQIIFATGAGSVGCSVTPAGLVSITGAATGASYCIIKATLAPDATFAGAGPISQSFNIARAALTVTADNVSATFGTEPAIGTAFTGFVGTDNYFSLSGPLVYTFQGISPTSYGPSTVVPTNPGVFSITPSGLTSNNYTISFVAGTLTINRAPGSVSISNLPSSGTVGGSFTATFTSEGDGVVSLTSKSTGICTVSGDVVQYIAAGTCVLQASVAQGTNHQAAVGLEQSFNVVPAAPTFSSACTYTVNPKNASRAVTVTWENAVPGVTQVNVSTGDKISRKQLAPTASGSWNTNSKSAVPTYELLGGAARRVTSTTLVPVTACTIQP